MISSGAGTSISASALIPAHLSYALTGHARITGNTASTHHLVLSSIRPGDTAIYRFLDFNGESAMTLRGCAKGCCTVEVRAENELCSTITWADTDVLTESTAPLSRLEGRHTVTLRFIGDFEDATLDEWTGGA